MKKLMFAALACLGLAMTGCKPDSDWTPEKTYELGLKIGGTAGAVVQAQHYDAKITDKSLEVVDLVVGLVPDKGQTFKEVWSPKITEFLDKQKDMSALTKLGVSLISGVLISALDKKVAENPEILEKKILDFINGDYDILLSTSIMENGIDIPNANTIIINDAHHFGLSDLHQMRGRISSRRMWLSVQVSLS